MNIFGRSQEAEAFETKTIAVTATPPLTRIVQSAYVTTSLRTYWGYDTAFNTADVAGIGSKTISALNTGDVVISKFCGFLETQPGTGSDCHFQLGFPYTNGAIEYNEHFSTIVQYTIVPDNSFGFVECEWMITKTSANEILMTWNIKIPNPTKFSTSMVGTIINFTTNRRICTYEDGSPLTLDIIWGCNSPDHRIYLYPTHFSIDVMRSVALTAGYT